MGRYDPCPICGSFAKNPNHYGRIEGKHQELCDRCYWQAEAEMLQKENEKLREACEHHGVEIPKRVKKGAK